MPRKTPKTPARSGGAGPFGLYGPVLHLGLMGPAKGQMPKGPPRNGPPVSGKGIPDTRRPHLPRRNGG
jgi:hypothetical protein